MRLSPFAIFLAVTATGVATGAERALNPTFESPAPLSAQSPIDARVFDRLKRLDIQPAFLSSDAVFPLRAIPHRPPRLRPPQTPRHPTRFSLFRRRLPPPRLPRRHRYPAHRAGSCAVPRRPRPRQTRRPHRPPPGTPRVRRLLGHEVERPAACQGGVPHRPLAQRRAGLSPLDPRRDPRKPALRPLRPRTLDWKRQQFPRRAGEFLPRHAKQGTARHRPDRRPHLHGNARRKLAPRTPRRHGRLLLPNRLQRNRRVEGGDRLLQAPARWRLRPARRLPRWNPGASGPRPRSARGLRRLAHRAPEPLVCAQRRQPRVELAAGSRHHPRTRRYPAG